MGQELTVSAAASLANAFTELADRFMAKTPGAKVNTNFAASNPLLAQLKRGAPVDVFASADEATMDQAVEAGVVDPATRRDFAGNTLVLIMPEGKTMPRNLEELARLKTIAIGNPDSAPAGRYTKEALTRAGLWDKLSSKFVQGESVRQVLDYVARGEADAGFVYGTDARQQADNVDVIMAVAGHEPVTYPIAVARTGNNPGEGQQFVDFVCSPEGQAILAAYGFAAPGSK